MRAGRFRADKRRGLPARIASPKLAGDGGGTRHASDARRGHGQASGWARKHRIHGRHQGEGNVRKNWMPGLSSSDAIRIRSRPNAGGYRGPIQLVRPNLPSWITVRLCLPLFSPRVTDSSDNGPRGYSLLSCDKQSWKKIVGIMVPSYCLTILGELLNELWFNRKDIIYNGFTECLQAVISSPTAPLVYYGLHGWPTIVYRLGWRSASLGKRNTNLY